MKVADYIVDYLVNQGVTDVFGIPGGVVLDLIYAFDARHESIKPHLSYHEQAAGFAACGYAQSSGRLGVAYGTRGPGFTNLITAIADTYCDSIPVLFITGHSSSSLDKGMRVMDDQEIDTCSMVSNITKFSMRVDTIDQVAFAISEACRIAMDGRKGPVFLDFSSSLMRKEMPDLSVASLFSEVAQGCFDFSEIVSTIRESKRPIFLVGDGINQSSCQNQFCELINQVKIPVVSSRFSHNIMGDSDLYYGYIGSHGIRFANFVLSKADLIVSIGNRMHYPVGSESFKQITNNAKVLRIDIDGSEFKRKVPNSINYNVDLKVFLDYLINYDLGNHSQWISICDLLRKELHHTDVNSCVEDIASVFTNINSCIGIVCDVGNNEFWVSRAAVLARISNRVYYSKSFGALGCGLSKAIGVYYSTQKPVLCFVGDQGLQINIQELQFIAQNQLPIAIVLLNNHSSGMIKDRETIAFNGQYLHTTMDSGFSNPDYKTIIEGYGIEYISYDGIIDIDFDVNKPLFVEMEVDSDLSLSPSLPKGVLCQDLYPQIDRITFNKLNSL